MIYKQTVPLEFINQREQKLKKYRGRGRSKEEHRLDLDCELHEFMMLNEKPEEYKPHNNILIDYIHNNLSIDVKFVRDFFNINEQKMLNIIEQRKFLNGYEFFRWCKIPTEPLKENDEVSYKYLGYMSYDDVMDRKNLKVSFKNSGFYLDMRERF